jgi:hypothetical protein
MSRYVRAEAAAAGRTRTRLLLVQHRLGVLRAVHRDARAPIRLERHATGWTARTAFIDETQRVADGVVDRALAGVLEDNGRLVAEIGVRAGEVVYQHDVLGQRNTVHHRRLGKSIQIWQWTAVAATARVDAVVHGLDEIVRHYWGRLSVRHPDLQPDGRYAESDDVGPVRIVRGESWARLDALVPPVPVAGTPPPPVLRRAFEIVTAGAPSGGSSTVTAPFPRREK